MRGHPYKEFELIINREYSKPRISKPRKSRDTYTAKIGYGGSMSTLGKDPIIIKNSPFPYEFQLKAIPSFEKVYNGFGAYSYTGMTFNLRRKSLGQLLSGYYYPTGSFAVLSLISFLINPDQVTY